MEGSSGYFYDPYGSNAYQPTVSPFLDSNEGSPTEGDLMFQHLFRTPSELTEDGSFAEVKAAARSQEKWILVNLQNQNEFSSLVLNRDVWSDETMQEFLKSCFLFWQREAASPEGQTFANNYKVTSFPHLAVVDPRTGRCVKTWPASKFRDSFAAIELLSNFLDSNQFDLPKPVSHSVSHSVSQAPPAPAAAPAAPPVASLPELPAAGAAGTVRVALRLSSGVREQLTVLPETQLGVLLQWAAAKEGVCLAGVSVKTAHPVKSLREDFAESDTVESAGLAGSLLTVTRS